MSSPYAECLDLRLVLGKAYAGLWYRTIPLGGIDLPQGSPHSQVSLPSSGYTCLYSSVHTAPRQLTKPVSFLEGVQCAEKPPMTVPNKHCPGSMLFPSLARGALR